MCASATASSGTSCGVIRRCSPSPRPQPICRPSTSGDSAHLGRHDPTVFEFVEPVPFVAALRRRAGAEDVAVAEPLVLVATQHGGGIARLFEQLLAAAQLVPWPVGDRRMVDEDDLAGEVLLQR